MHESKYMKIVASHVTYQIGNNCSQMQHYAELHLEGECDDIIQIYYPTLLQTNTNYSTLQPDDAIASSSPASTCESQCW